MNSNPKNESAYKTIGEVTKELGLINKNNGHPQTHTLRYWETQFKQIKPYVRAGGRRYYSKKNFQIIKLIKILLKDKGLTIGGVKKILENHESDSIDEVLNMGLYKSNLYTNKIVKEKLKKISKLIKELKDYK